MRRLLLTLCVLHCAVALSAQTTARQWLERLDASLGERYAMTLHIAMTNAEQPLIGYLMIDGDSFYLTLGAMEVYSDGKLRYEVNNERKEVTEDRVNLSSADLLSNPTRAFEFVGEQFDVALLSANATDVELHIKPLDADMGISNIALSLKVAGGKVLPDAIVYDYDGEVVGITLEMMDAKDKALPRWSKDRYRAYDIVSFL
jgi:hypothetical protein